MTPIARTPVTALLCAGAALYGTRAAAQEPSTPASAAAAPAPAEAPKWAFEVSGFTVNPPDDDAYAATVLRADREALHLEGRWNYEDLHTGSLFAGWNLDWSGQWHGDLELHTVPMVGVVAGDTDGIAPALEVGFSWGLLELWSESEYVFALDDRDAGFFYSWNELSAAPVEWLRLGIVGQRTRAFHQDRVLDRGLLLGTRLGSVSATVYWFNPFDSGDSYATLAIAFSF